MTRTTSCFTFIVLLHLCSSIVYASPIQVSTLSPYNAFVFGDFHATVSDVEGNAAIGGDLTTTDYSFGLELDPVTAVDSDVLSLGGDAVLTRTRVYHGDLVHSGNNTLTNTGVDGVIRSPSTVDFDLAQQRYSAFSRQLSELQPTGLASSEFNKLSLAGTSPGVNVFLVTPDLWKDSNGGDVTVIDLDIPTDSTAVINVAGAAPEISTLGFDDVVANLPSPFRHHTLFNFFEAEQVTTRNIGLEGALLAPNASLDHLDAVIYGQVIAGSFSGNGQIDLEPFAGTLPIPVPESQGQGMLLIFGACLLRVSRRSALVRRFAFVT